MWSRLPLAQQARSRTNLGISFGRETSIRAARVGTTAEATTITQNLNAADNPTPGFMQEPSIMRSGLGLQQSYETFAFASVDAGSDRLARQRWRRHFRRAGCSA